MGNTFRDAEGRNWTVAVNVNGMKAVKTLLGLELHRLFDNKLQPLADLFADPPKLVDVLYVLCKDQADKAAISDEDFGRAMYGDALSDAADAFFGAVVDFVPDRANRKALRKFRDASRIAGEHLLSKMEKEAEALSPDELAKQILSKLNEGK
jgi:hypothetical protein